MEKFDYSPLWETMKRKEMNRYKLIYKYGIKPQIYQNIKNGKSITVYTLVNLCHILECTPNDILKI